ncbi:hypothetical protein LVJ83_03195 [Uruburuella testudinis]|uniref:Uncharacterized protein n=1 Tax=Uruburuella testudinis TaxID=1282863 RepID=A0ABY4DTX2_9NEIS|nr:hypothetical protein [Uruburuella testudinis]UOO82488.1 hypothetical protein LVJ83_03195 [Uruburuella testudinis]
MNNSNPTPAQLMESQEHDAVKQERCDDYLERKATEAEQAQAAPAPVVGQSAADIQPKVEVNTDQISECHEPTSADEMEAEERELVIEGSVDDTLTYAQKPLSDEEVREKSLTRLDQIDPYPKDGKQC